MTPTHKPSLIIAVRNPALYEQALVYYRRNLQPALDNDVLHRRQLSGLGR